MAGSLFYLDSYRNQLLEERFKLARSEARDHRRRPCRDPARRPRARCWRGSAASSSCGCGCTMPQGELVLDSFALAEPASRFVDPASEPWYQEPRAALDRAMNFVLGSARDPALSRPADRPRRGLARTGRRHGTGRPGDRGPARRARPDPGDQRRRAGRHGGETAAGRPAMPPTSPRRCATRARRWRSCSAVTLLISIQLSLFLARTIVQPLRALVRAAVRVRLGRDREVVVPRLPERRDEIGLLARALVRHERSAAPADRRGRSLRRRCRA